MARGLPAASEDAYHNSLILIYIFLNQYLFMQQDRIEIEPKAGFTK